MGEEQEIENRRDQRVPAIMHLRVSSVFKQNNVHVNNLNATIEVIDISKYGIGFVTKSILPIGFYFDLRLKFEDGRDSINCVVRIVRRKQCDDGFTVYGCEFVGMSPVFDYIFDGTAKNCINKEDYPEIED